MFQIASIAKMKTLLFKLIQICSTFLAFSFQRNGSTPSKTKPPTPSPYQMISSFNNKQISLLMEISIKTLLQNWAFLFLNKTTMMMVILWLLWMDVFHWMEALNCFWMKDHQITKIFKLIWFHIIAALFSLFLNHKFDWKPITQTINVTQFQER